jgi:hypothetical protein
VETFEALLGRLPKRLDISHTSDRPGTRVSHHQDI